MSGDNQLLFLTNEDFFHTSLLGSNHHYMLITPWILVADYWALFGMPMKSFFIPDLEITFYEKLFNCWFMKQYKMPDSNMFNHSLEYLIISQINQQVKSKNKTWSLSKTTRVALSWLLTAICIPRQKQPKQRSDGNVPRAIVKHVE